MVGMGRREKLQDILDGKWDSLSTRALHVIRHAGRSAEVLSGWNYSNWLGERQCGDTTAGEIMDWLRGGEDLCSDEGEKPICHCAVTGMTLRDYFAAAAISRCLETEDCPDLAARKAYKIADLMLKERELNV